MNDVIFLIPSPAIKPLIAGENSTPIKPKSATKSAPCIKCFRKLSFIFAKSPSKINGTPKNKGINAVIENFPSDCAAKAPAIPIKLNKTPQIIEYVGIN